MGKTGLEYFSLDTILDDKVNLLEAEFGLKGFAVLVHLFQKIYGGMGYFCEWDDEVDLLFSRKECSLAEGDRFVSEVVDCAIRRGIFDEKLFKDFGILTSRGIQKRYFEAVKRRKEVSVKNEYLLVNGVQNMGNVNISEGNVNINGKNVCRNQQSKVKESKVKESKEKEKKWSPSGSDYFSDPELIELFNDFLPIRKKKRKQEETTRSINSLVKKLNNMPDWEKKIALENAIEGAWITVYPIKNDQSTQQKNGDDGNPFKEFI